MQNSFAPNPPPPRCRAQSEAQQFALTIKDHAFRWIQAGSASGWRRSAWSGKGVLRLPLTSTLSLLDLSILQSKTLQLVLCFPSFTDFLYQTFKYIQGNLLISSLKSGKASQKSWPRSRLICKSIETRPSATYYIMYEYTFLSFIITGVIECAQGV